MKNIFITTLGILTITGLSGAALAQVPQIDPKALDEIQEVYKEQVEKEVVKPEPTPDQSGEALEGSGRFQNLSSGLKEEEKDKLISLKKIAKDQAQEAQQSRQGVPDEAFSGGEAIIAPKAEEVKKITEQVKENSEAQSKKALSKMADPDTTVIEKPKSDNEYHAGTVSNFSKLFWKLGVFDKNNKVAIDNFMLINECPIYSAFYHDDFQWADIQTSASKMIEREKENFPHKFNFIVPIDLGRYDKRMGGFPLISNTAFNNLRRVQIGGNSNSMKICDKQGEIEGYPKNLIMVTAKPVTMNFIRVDEHVAQGFLVRRKYSSPEVNNISRRDKFERPAFMSVYTTISHYQGKKDTNSGTFAEVFGKVDKIEVYEDQELRNLLYARKM